MIRKKHKYRAKKVQFNGIKFDSKKESKRYLILADDLKKNVIESLILQPGFMLQEGFRIEGKKIRDLVYKADFMYLKEGVLYIEDVKGYKTSEYQLKKKLILKQIAEDRVCYINPDTKSTLILNFDKIKFIET